MEHIISTYFPELTTQQLEQFILHEEVLLSWNEKINLISRKDTDEFAVRHVLHSLALAKVARFKKGKRVLDVGTGGGFPGIPLAIMYPEVQFHLVDSIAKKIKVVEDVVEQLNLTNVTCTWGRAEQLSEPVDMVVSRAVTRFPVFVQWVRKNIKPGIGNGIYYLKGGELKQDLEHYMKKVDIVDINEFFPEPFFETKKVVHLPF